MYTYIITSEQTEKGNTSLTILGVASSEEKALRFLKKQGLYLGKSGWKCERLETSEKPTKDNNMTTAWAKLSWVGQVKMELRVEKWKAV
jgi:hypothetical protein